MSRHKRVRADEMKLLSHPITKLLRYQPLTSLTNALWAQGVRRVGELVVLSEGEIRAIAPRTSPAALVRVKERLSGFDLELGMDTKGWKSPDRPCRKAAAARVSQRGMVIRGMKKG